MPKMLAKVRMRHLNISCVRIRQVRKRLTQYLDSKNKTSKK